MYIKVIVFPESKKVSIEEIKENTFKVFVKEKAKQNLANTAVRNAIAKKFSILVSKVKIISGHHGPRKMLSLDTDN